jgi:superfamily II DNA/RNA helicase
MPSAWLPLPPCSTTTGRSARWPSAIPSSSAATLLNVLRAQGFQALTLHGDLEQRDRDQVLIQFANRSCSVLVATDVAARGLDIAQLEAVINVDVTPDPEIHIHRIGRTGRADQDGLGAEPGTAAEPDGPAWPTIAQMKAKQGAPEWHPLSELQPGSRQAPAAARRWSPCRSSAAARTRSAPAMCSAR